LEIILLYLKISFKNKLKYIQKIFILNNNFYKLWKNHRKVLTFTGILFLFAFYLRPFVIEVKYKNSCILLSEKLALFSYSDEAIMEEIKTQTGLSIEEIAKIEAYQNCN